MSDSLWPHGLYNPWNSPGQNTVVGSFFLLQGIFPTQGLNPGLPHCRQILYQLSHQESPWNVSWGWLHPFHKKTSQAVASPRRMAGTWLMPTSTEPSPAEVRLDQPNSGCCGHLCPVNAQRLSPGWWSMQHLMANRLLWASLFIDQGTFALWAIVEQSWGDAYHPTWESAGKGIQSILEASVVTNGRTGGCLLCASCSVMS